MQRHRRSRPNEMVCECEFRGRVRDGQLQLLESVDQVFRKPQTN